MKKARREAEELKLKIASGTIGSAASNGDEARDIAGVKVLAKTHLFDTTSWSVPSLVGATLYARDRAKIVALDLGGPGGG